MSSIISGFFILLSIFFSKTKPRIFKKRSGVLFLTIAIPISLASLFLLGSTIYLDLVSETKGPVHWHADFEIWNCQEKLELIDPETLANRVGTSLLHEHNDNRIHIEGVLLKRSQADLHSFFDVVGGSITEDSLTILSNQGFVKVKNSDLCNGKKGRLQVFVYRITNPDSNKKAGFLYKQIKLENFTDHIVSPYTSVPPGDCIIIEFDEEKEKTDKLCLSYEIAIQKGELKER